jgi:hypothetical protein
MSGGFCRAFEYSPLDPLVYICLEIFAKQTVRSVKLRIPYLTLINIVVFFHVQSKIVIKIE